MLARVTTFAIDGLEPRRITVEVDLRLGLPAFTIVGRGDLAVRESRERVQAALLNSGFTLPGRRITVNLAPAHLRKVGPGFDLATACGVLAASEQVPSDMLERWAVFGELSLGGELRHCRGALAVAEGARGGGLTGLVVPRECAREAALVEGLRVAPASSLEEVAAILRGAPPDDCALAGPAAVASPPAAGGDVDLADVRGHHLVIAALTVAAAGGHNLLLSGPPGVGKTMLARRLPGLLPPLSRREAIEVTRIHSVAGHASGNGLVQTRPLRAPHHTISSSGLVGGGAEPRPGEASLAHHGVLFLDELSEFSRTALEALRQPLEDGRVAIVRGQRTVTYPAGFQLVASTNPCPCGFAGDPSRCGCSDTEIQRHARRLSGPLLDRIDIVISLSRPSPDAFEHPVITTSAEVRERVAAARERQGHRLAGTGLATNAQLSAGLTERLARPDAAGRRALQESYVRGDISARGRQRALRVALTVADLAGSHRITRSHVRQALGYRPDAGGHAEQEEAA